MKRTTFLLILLMLVAFTPQAAAQSEEDLETGNIEIGDIEFRGGVTYNTFADAEDFEEEELGSGLGFFMGGRYWLFDSLGVEGGLDYASQAVEKDKEEEEGTEVITNRLVGPYMKGNYELFDWLSVQGGLAYYVQQEKEENGDEDPDTRTGLGLLLGSEVGYELDEKLSISAHLGGRLASVSSDDEEPENRNMSGLRIRFGFTYKLF